MARYTGTIHSVAHQRTTQVIQRTTEYLSANENRHNRHYTSGLYCSILALYTDYTSTIYRVYGTSQHDRTTEETKHYTP